MGYDDEVLADNPLGYWRLGEASGTTLTDSSPNGRNGTYSGTPAFGTAGALLGDPDTCVTFSGDDWGNIPYAAWMDVGTAMSVEAWIKTTAAGLHQIFSRDDAAGTRAFQFRTSDANLQMVKIAGGTVTSTAAVAINDGNWHHVVATYDGSNIRLYNNGALAQTTAGSGSLNSDDVIRIGNRPSNNEPFVGQIDEVAYYGTVLSLARIQAHYQAGITANTPIDAASGSWVANDVAIATITDTTNKLGGFRLGGYISNEAPDPAMPTPPAIWTHTRRDDMALYLPPPVIVDGRIVR